MTPSRETDIVEILEDLASRIENLSGPIVAGELRQAKAEIDTLRQRVKELEGGTGLKER